MQSDTPLVSVIISAYNSAAWIKQTLDSLLTQTYTQWEALVIDDASTDGTLSILNEYAYTDKRFKVYKRTENTGYVKNLNFLIPQCEGVYIARLDADDVCTPNRLALQVAYMQKYKVNMVTGYIDVVNEKNVKIGEWNADRNNYTPVQIRNTMPWHNCIAHPTVMIQANILKANTYNEAQTSSEDWHLWLQLLAYKYTIGKVPEVVLYYRKLTTSVTAKSLQQSAYTKNHNTYTIYLKQVSACKQWNRYNYIVLVAYYFNYCKMILSNLKKRILS